MRETTNDSPVFYINSVSDEGVGEICITNGYGDVILEEILGWGDVSKKTSSLVSLLRLLEITNGDLVVFSSSRFLVNVFVKKVTLLKGERSYLNEILKELKNRNAKISYIHKKHNLARVS